MFRTIVSTLALACAAAIGCVGSASAADMAVKQRPATQAYAAEPASWTGWYVGGHGGYGWGSMSPEIDITPFSNPDPKGWVGGGHVGYLWQNGQLAGGLEVDYSVADINQSQSAPIGPGVGAPTIGLNTKFDALASARGRFGVIVGNDVFLYGTGGLGFAKSKSSVNFCAPDCTTFASAAENHWGWVIGGGAEIKISNIVIGAEYLHYDFGTQQHNFALNPAFTVPVVLGIKADSTVDVVRGRASI